MMKQLKIVGGHQGGKMFNIWRMISLMWSTSKSWRRGGEWKTSQMSWRRRRCREGRRSLIWSGSRLKRGLGFWLAWSTRFGHALNSFSSSWKSLLTFLVVERKCFFPLKRLTRNWDFNQIKLQFSVQHINWKSNKALLKCSAQRVPEPDPLPGISFDTRPDPIQF